MCTARVVHSVAAGQSSLSNIVEECGARLGSTAARWALRTAVTAPAFVNALAHMVGSGDEGQLSDSAESSNSSFFHVAIDCPGYGGSSGDRQTVRSYPAELLQQVIRALGKTRALALVGCSQGACAVLNALVEDTSLADFAAVTHPVGHDVSRYSKIAQPTMLLFDTDDAGHPVAVGRLMRKALPCAVYFEHSSDADPGFYERRFGAELLRMLREQRPAQGGGAANSARLPLLAEIAGGLRSWAGERAE